MNKNLSEWILYYTYSIQGKSGFVSLVTTAKDEDQAKRKACEIFKLTRANVVFWDIEKLS